jgi:DNA helicase-2/ATP-dependent DNA helicase PcrA
MMTKAAYRTLRGLRERTITSPFLNEIPRESLDVVDRTGIDVRGDRSGTRGAFPEPQGLAKTFRKGQNVRHPTFGVGKLLDVIDMGQHTRAIVEFHRVGRKTLILEYVRLEVVG